MCLISSSNLFIVLYSSRHYSIANNLRQWLLVDVVIMNEHTIDLKPERAIPAVEIDISVAL